MITIWNQREVYVGRSTEELNKVRAILKKAGIRFKCKPFRTESSHAFDTKSAAADFFNWKLDHANGFFTYVHKNDSEKATELLETIKQQLD